MGENNIKSGHNQIATLEERITLLEEEMSETSTQLSSLTEVIAELNSFSSIDSAQNLIFTAFGLRTGRFFAPIVVGQVGGVQFQPLRMKFNSKCKKGREEVLIRRSEVFCLEVSVKKASDCGVTVKNIPKRKSSEHIIPGNSLAICSDNSRQKETIKIDCDGTSGDCKFTYRKVSMPGAKEFAKGYVDNTCKDGKAKLVIKPRGDYKLYVNVEKASDCGVTVKNIPNKQNEKFSPGESRSISFEKDGWEWSTIEIDCDDTSGDCKDCKFSYTLLRS